MDAELPQLLRSRPDVKRIRTRYQDLDVVWDAHVHSRPELGLLDLSLFLNGHFQFSALDERRYHEWIVHVPVMLTGQVPRRVLILGAGDGLLAREVLRYGERIERVVQVELDPVMIELARHDGQLARMNGGSLSDPRVQVVVDDALTWLRSTPTDEAGTFDAVFMDFPYPYDYDLARLYSVEFLRSVRAHLAPDGWLAFDYPLLHGGFGERAEAMNTIIISTVRAARFGTALPFGDDDETFILATPAVRALTFERREAPAGFPADLEYVDAEAMRTLGARTFPHRVDPSKVSSVLHPRLFALTDLRF